MKRPDRPFQLQLRGEIFDHGGQAVYIYFRTRGGMWVRVGALVADFWEYDIAVSNFNADMREAWRRIRGFAKSVRGRR